MISHDEDDTQNIPVVSPDPRATGQHEAAWGIDKGKVRETNEDSLAAVTLNEVDQSGEKAIGVFAVADGMGGHAAGEVASKIAIRTAIRKLVAEVTRPDDEMPEDYSNWLESAVQLANKMVRKEASQTGHNMGTTLVLAVMVGREVHVANVGDSRAYLITSEGIRRITHDHSFVQTLVDGGNITPEEAAKHPYRNVLTQAIGSEEEIKVDVFDETLDEDASLLLCSDGLWEMLGERQIYQIVRDANSPHEACQSLIDASNAAGGLDNIAAVLVRLSPETSQQDNAAAAVS